MWKLPLAPVLVLEKAEWFLGEYIGNSKQKASKHLNLDQNH